MLRLRCRVCPYRHASCMRGAQTSIVQHILLGANQACRARLLSMTHAAHLVTHGCRQRGFRHLQRPQGLLIIGRRGDAACVPCIARQTDRQTSFGIELWPQLIGETFAPNFQHLHKRQGFCEQHHKRSHAELWNAGNSTINMMHTCVHACMQPCTRANSSNCFCKRVNEAAGMSRVPVHARMHVLAHMGAPAASNICTDLESLLYTVVSNRCLHVWQCCQSGTLMALWLWLRPELHLHRESDKGRATRGDGMCGCLYAWRHT